MIHKQVHTEVVAPGKKFQCCLHGTENSQMETAAGRVLEESVLDSWIFARRVNFDTSVVVVHVALYSLCSLAKELTCSISHARRW